ncbi:MAG: hypothetical protein GY724_17935 [Actinomycetia bacterium]|nr:hypothetical protein [Actinomycetes bacterium]MCP5030759.1 hypothetical protein [Actinomycetes bacterium]
MLEGGSDDTYNPLRIAYHEFIDIGRDVKAARSWPSGLGPVLRWPGWRPVPQSPKPASFAS